MATATTSKTTVVTLTLTEDEAIGLKTLLNFNHIPPAVEGAENIARVGRAMDTVFQALDDAGVECAYLARPFCKLCGQRIDDGKPCGCGDR